MSILHLGIGFLNGQVIIGIRSFQMALVSKLKLLQKTFNIRNGEAPRSVKERLLEL